MFSSIFKNFHECLNEFVFIHPCRCPIRFSYQNVFVSHELLILRKQLGSRSIFSGVSVAKSFVFFVVWCGRCLCILLSCCYHCITCPSPNYGLWIPFIVHYFLNTCSRCRWNCIEIQSYPHLCIMDATQNCLKCKLSYSDQIYYLIKLDYIRQDWYEYAPSKMQKKKKKKKKA